MAVHVPHPVAELVTKMTDDLVRGMTVGAEIAAVLDQRNLGVVRAEDVIVQRVYRRVQSGRAGLLHGHASLDHH